MDFNEIKKRALELKDKAIEYKDIAIDKGEKWMETLRNSKVINLKTIKELEYFIESNKKTIIIFLERWSKIDNKLLLLFPVIFTKWWISAYKLKTVYSDMESLDLSKYKIETTPTLVVFEEEEIKKTVDSEENIYKIVKAMNLDLDKTIDELQ